MADVDIPIEQWILLYIGEFETKAIFCTFTYFKSDVKNMLLFNCWMDLSCFDQKLRFLQLELNLWKLLYLVALINHKEIAGLKDTV
jgi:uncharacterized membrane protein YhdT